MRQTGITIVLAFALIASAAIAFAGSSPEMNGYDVAYVKLDQSYTTKEKVTYTHAYLVRVMGDFPKNRAEVMWLYLGEDLVPEYGSFPGGIYFRIYDKSKLAQLAGNIFGYRIGKGEVKSFDIKFEPAKFDLTKAQDERSVFMGK